jgi:hypothetical protein
MSDGPNTAKNFKPPFNFAISPAPHGGAMLNASGVW